MLQVPINDNESLYVSFSKTNDNGFFCEVYNELNEKVDDFVIGKNELLQYDAEQIAINYIIDSFR